MITIHIVTSILRIISRVSALQVILLFANFVSLHAQVISIGNVGVCSESSVSVPINGSGLSNIGAITLYIQYDSTTMTFLSLEDVDPQISQVMHNHLSNPPRVTIVWSKTTGVNFPSNTMLKLKFAVTSPSGNLNFMRQYCEIATSDLPPVVVPVEYVDGVLFPSIPLVTANPENKTIQSQSNAQFDVSSPNASTYSWQESRNGGISWNDLAETATYSGTGTNVLLVKQVPASFNQFRYRCVVRLNQCPVPSADALLSVDSVAGIGPIPEGGMPFSLQPNPFTSKCAIEYTVPAPGKVTIQVLDLTGRIRAVPVEKTLQAGLYRQEENFVTLPAGIYFCRYLFEGASGNYETNRKLIKQE